MASNCSQALAHPVLGGVDQPAGCKRDASTEVDCLSEWVLTDFMVVVALRRARPGAGGGRVGRSDIGGPVQQAREKAEWVIFLMPDT